MAIDIRLKLLGGFSLTNGDGSAIRLPAGKGQALLAYLALNPDEDHPRTKLAALLWGDQDEKHARGNLSQCLFRLRKALGDDATGILDADKENVRLNGAQLDVDALILKQMTKTDEAEAVALCAGPLLDSFAIRQEGFEDWLAQERATYLGLMDQALTRCVESRLVGQNADGAVDAAHQLVAMDALNEEAHRLLMRSYATAGRRHAALQQYRACKEVLRRELDVEPDATTKALYEEIQSLPANKGGAVSEEPLPLPNKSSIAVLPFNNMSGDPELEYFADGMTEDIITELSRFVNLIVIARNTSFTFKDQRVDVKDVAQELGARFILEGSVRKTGQRVRITAQLINGQDGGHLWAERYDGALEDVFDLQEQVTSQVVGSISKQITQVELGRIGKGERIFDEAHELAWQAMKTYRSGLRLADPSMIERAIVMATDSVNMDAECAMAYATLCLALMSQGLYRWGDDPAASTDLSEDWANKFISQVPNSYMAFNYLGIARLRKGEYQLANLDFQHAHELNANDVSVLRFWSSCEASMGEFEKAKKHAHMAIRLSPKDSVVGIAYGALAMAAFIEKDTVEFEDWAGKAIQSQPNVPLRRAMMIAYAAETGNQALLETHRTELMRVAPDFIDSLFRGENKVFQQPEHMAMLLDGLRKAGFSV